MRWLMALVIALMTIAPVMGEQVIVNSMDWRDVYTGLQYAALSGLEARFVVNVEQGTRLAQLLGQDMDVLLITGRNQAMPGFRSLVQSRGYSVEEYMSRDPLITNKEFALRSPSNNVVIVDDAYGYNAVSVATYAKLRGSSVLFADSGVFDVIDEKRPNEILLYGHIPAELYEELETYNPVVINEQDRFDDNFAIVKRYTEYSPKESLILSNGEFIESQLIAGDSPLLFMGRQVVPDDVIDFINDNGFRVGTMVGNALAPNAQYIKDRTGISIFLKFAQGSQQQQFALDLFPLPRYNPLLTITASGYDPSTRLLSVTYENPGEIAVYLSASFTTSDGTVEDVEPVFIESGTHKTVQYSMSDPGDRVDYLILYGASPNSLELLIQGTLDITRTTINDRSEVRILRGIYDKSSQEFLIDISNIGDVDAFALVELRDVRKGGEYLRLASSITSVAAGEEVTVKVPVELSDQDLNRNHELAIELFYGQREASLIKFEELTVPFETTSGGIPIWFVALAVVVGLLLVWLVARRPRKRKREQLYYGSNF